MRAEWLIVSIASIFALGACGSSGPAPTSPGSPATSTTTSPSAPVATVSSPRPINHAATKAWISAVLADTKALKDEAENLQYAWSGALVGGSQSRGYTFEVDQVAVNNVEPDAAKLSELLHTTAQRVASVDSTSELDFVDAVGQWQHVAALAHAIKTTAQKYNSTTKTTDAISAFEAQLSSAETLWNAAVVDLWSVAGSSNPPTVNSACSPADKSACS